MDTRYALFQSTASDRGANLYRRLDSINVNAAERERVKHDLHAAETTVDAVLGLGGTVAVADAPGGGADFIITIPTAKDRAHVQIL